MIQVINIRDPRPKDGAVVPICRPSDLGNPFVPPRDGTVEEVIKKYEAWFVNRLRTEWQFCAKISWLVRVAMAGNLYLACYCSPRPCHGDFIKAFVEEVIKNAEKNCDC